MHCMPQMPHRTCHSGNVFSIDHNKTFVRRSLNVGQGYSGGHFRINYLYMFAHFARKNSYLGAVYMIPLCRDATRRDSIVMY